MEDNSEAQLRDRASKEEHPQTHNAEQTSRLTTNQSGLQPDGVNATSSQRPSLRQDRRRSHVYDRPKLPLYRATRKQMPEHVRNRWTLIVTKSLRRERLRTILASFLARAGEPCIICNSMKLTEDKFMINEYSKHQRLARAIIRERDLADEQVATLVQPDDMEFGPNGLKLGTLQEIHSRNHKCPFCRLVTRSLQDQPREKSQRGDNGEDIPIVDQDVETWPERNAVCYASWQVDGRVLTRDKDTGQILGSRASTRRIRLHWDWEKFSDTYVVLMASHTRKSPGLFLGRTLHNARIDAAAIRQWTESCINNHVPGCCPKDYDFSGWKSFFGVIDVNEMMLTSLPHKARYVTLSYVWGQNQIFRTKKTNIYGLLSPGGIRNNFQDLPRTIRDSIELVRAMGERYLWIDALCIIQDSKRSWTLNSRVMDLVYGNSYLNICAADGTDAHAGLRGLDPTASASQQIIEQFSADVRLLATQPAENYIRQSLWNTRGWTFQERLLSPRNLIFVGGRIYFQCRTTARSVDIITEDPDAGWSLEFINSPLLSLDQLPGRPLAVFKKALELYMLRELTWPKDILAAFSGIGSLVSEASGGSLIHGLPSSHFDWALLWEARDAPDRRIIEKGDEQFPSWSWCGWKGQMMEYKPHILSGCEDNLHEWLMYHTWITWFIRDGNGNLRLVWGGGEKKEESGRINLRWRGYSRPDKMEEGVYDPYGRPIKQDERDLPRSKSENFKQVLDECPFGVSIIEGTTRRDSKSDAFIRNNPAKDMPYLQFFTWSASFRLRDMRQQDFDRKFQRYSILDYKDDWCGTILLDRLRIAPLDLDKTHEFIAISDAKEFHSDEYNGWAYYIPKEKEQSAWDLYYVLLIEYRSNIAYRVGLGKIFKEAFNNSCKPEGKQWKEFILG